MNHEERAAWIRRGIVVFLAVIVVMGVWLFPGKKAPPPLPVAAPKFDLEIQHFHQAGNPESDEIARSLSRIQEKYQKVLILKQVDMAAQAAEAAAQGVKKAPSVIMMVEGKRVFAFQGKWPHSQIERKVDEILRGLKAVDKDWRPDVQGIDQGGKVTLPQSGSPAKAPPGAVPPSGKPKPAAPAGMTVPSGNSKPALPDPQPREAPLPKP